MTESILVSSHADWKAQTLEDVAELQTGPFGSQLHSTDYVSEGVPSIMPVNMSGDRIDVSAIRRITQLDAARLKRYLVQEGDIIVSRRGDVGRRALISDRESGWLCGTGCLRIRFDSDRVAPGYAYYYLGHPRVQTWIRNRAVGATMPNLNTAILSGLPILLPPVQEQRLIGACLGALDDKIELNRTLAATARELAYAIFRSRYRVDDPALPREPLGAHVDVARGLSYTGAGLADDGMPLHNLNSIYEGGGYKRAGIKFYRGDHQQRHLVAPGDVIIANTEQGFDELLIGFPARVPHTFGDEGLFSQHLYRVRPKLRSVLSAQFVYLMLLRGTLHAEVAGYANGTTVNMLPAEALQKPRFAVPPRALVEEIDALVTPLLDRAEAAEDESQMLAALRDTLLPKLVSGELRIRDGADARSQVSLASHLDN